jgi:thiamine biosynthesis lipoprotein
LFFFIKILILFNQPLKLKIIKKMTRSLITKINKKFISIILILLVASCSKSENYNAELKGNTMGTYYIINLVEIPKSLKLENIRSEIEKTLNLINSTLSNWDPNSEITKLNNNKKIGTIKISNDLKEVLKQANIINVSSYGYFDITADPLIELWGFGYKNKKTQTIPLQKEINDALLLVNQKELFEINSTNNEFYKKNKDLKLNLSSIAKGYGIDQIGKKLENLGLKNYLINIGGDLLAKGYNKTKKNWMIGIENPNLNEKLVKEVINVSNKGVASSGDYKNFFIKNGKQFSHIINPNTGKPITHKTKSVTVVSSNTTNADGWATALLAMGSEKGFKLAEDYSMAVLFIDEVNKKLIKIKSSEFKKLIKE